MVNVLLDNCLFTVALCIEHTQSHIYLVDRLDSTNTLIL